MKIGYIKNSSSTFLYFNFISIIAITAGAFYIEARGMFPKIRHVIWFFFKIVLSPLMTILEYLLIPLIHGDRFMNNMFGYKRRAW